MLGSNGCKKERRARGRCARETREGRLQTADGCRKVELVLLRAWHTKAVTESLEKVPVEIRFRCPDVKRDLISHWTRILIFQSYYTLYQNSKNTAYLKLNTLQYTVYPKTLAHPVVFKRVMSQFWLCLIRLVWKTINKQIKQWNGMLSIPLFRTVSGQRSFNIERRHYRMISTSTQTKRISDLF